MTHPSFPFVCCLFALPLLMATNGCGGCPWTSSSEAEATPDTPCLAIEVSDADRHLPDGSGGCVDPILYGTNQCQATLMFSGANLIGGVDVVVDPGQPFEVGVPFEAGDAQGDEFHFFVAADLGGTALTIAFSTYAP